MRSSATALDNKSMRIFVGIIVPLFIISGMVYLFFFRSPLFCIIHEFTGLHCPGCGVGRALMSILHLRFFTALRCNAALTLGMPLIVWYSLGVYLKFVFRINILPKWDFKPWMIYTIMIAIGVYSVLRNIPVFPFTLLVPPII